MHEKELEHTSSSSVFSQYDIFVNILFAELGSRLIMAYGACELTYRSILAVTIWSQEEYLNVSTR